MVRAGRRLWGLAILLGGLAGCRGPAVGCRFVVRAPVPTPPELPAVTPGRIEPDPSSLPFVDPNAAAPPADDPKLFRGLSEAQCRTAAAGRSTLGNLLDAENARPTPGGCDGGSGSVLREARAHAAQDARNKDAADALDRFFQLADAEARADLLALGLTAFDQLRAEAVKLRAAGLPAPADDELARQRSKLLADAEAAAAGIKLLNLDLKARLGLPTKGPERLWPTGDFAVAAAKLDADALVAAALEGRPDLRALRALYHGLSVELLPAARDLLRGTSGLLGTADPPPPVPGLVERLLSRHLPDPRAAAGAELETRRRQLFALIADREALAAAEVRAAVVAVESAARRVGLARGRVESLRARIDDVTAKGGRPAEVLQAELEWYRARAELVEEVMNWHRAGVKLGRAVGRFE